MQATPTRYCSRTICVTWLQGLVLFKRATLLNPRPQLLTEMIMTVFRTNKIPELLTAASAVKTDGSQTEASSPIEWEVAWRGGVLARSKPNPSSAVLTQLQEGERLIQLERKLNWVRHAKGWTIIQI